MKIIIIKECLDCPYVSPQKRKLEAANCRKKGKPIKSLENIPEWCPLKDFLVEPPEKIMALVDELLEGVES